VSNILEGSFLSWKFLTSKAFIIMTLYEAPMLFVDKKDNKLHICIDYCALNKITIKNNYPLFQIENMFDHLNGTCYLNWVNLKLNYYQICILDANVEKMTTRIKYVFCEFMVMLFGLCNVPSTFTILMNLVFHDKLDEFIIVYIDNILVYSKLA
jgi:hypothetical protein